MVTNRTSNGSAWAGWVIFAAVMLLIIGTFNIIEGVVALIDDKQVLVTPDRLIAVDLTGWGWTLIVFGSVMVAAGIGLLSAQTWARVTGIIIVSLHAVSQVAWLAAYPIWSLMMLALDVVVLYTLTARWQAARRDIAYSSASESRLD